MSDLLIKLWQNGILQLGIWETIYMTLISTFFAYLIGLPVGLILRMTDRDGIHPIGWLNRTLGIIVNALRSIPFIILMVAMLPVAKAIVGTSLGNRAVIVTLIVCGIAAAPGVTPSGRLGAHARVRQRPAQHPVHHSHGGEVTPATALRS